jgi:disulfide bond formation protein DsbB
MYENDSMLIVYHSFPLTTINFTIFPPSTIINSNYTVREPLLMVKNEKSLENLLLGAWGVSLAATLGSLYFSEIMKFIPCDLCWFQRIFMYPQVIILGLAAVRKEYGIARYSLTLSMIGGTISLYHYLLQKVPFFQKHAIACGRIPCTEDYIDWLGFITIPFLALTAFCLIVILNILIIRTLKEGKLH